MEGTNYIDDRFPCKDIVRYIVADEKGYCTIRCTRIAVHRNI